MARPSRSTPPSRLFYESIDLPIAEALRAEEAYWLYQATSQTPAIERFQWANDQGAQLDMSNQRRWEDMLVEIQDIGS